MLSLFLIMQATNLLKKTKQKLAQNGCAPRKLEVVYSVLFINLQDLVDVIDIFAILTIDILYVLPKNEMGVGIVYK